MIIKKYLRRSQAKASRRHHGMANKRTAFAESEYASLSAWPSSGQLRDSLQGRARNERECPYRFDQSL